MLKVKSPIVLMWDNFGPLHLDRIISVQRLLGNQRNVIGLELCGRSDTYGWNRSQTSTEFKHRLVFPDLALRDLSARCVTGGILSSLRDLPRGDIFLCHWNEAGVFLAASLLRLRGHRLHTMGCSKFDDRPRMAWRESLKTLALLPYQGAIGSGERSRDYLRFLGGKRLKVVGEYNTVSLDRIREQAGFGPFAIADPAEGPDFNEREFVCVARLVPKKNLEILLKAFALYTKSNAAPRRLHLCGSGPLEEILREKAEQLGISAYVIFHGFVQSATVSAILRNGLALLLPSVEEQFGNVVPEALALGLPLIVSVNAGARDSLLRNGVNGFLIEPDNIEGLAWSLTHIAEDMEFWKRARTRSFELARRVDSARFAEGVAELCSEA